MEKKKHAWIYSLVTRPSARPSRVLWVSYNILSTKEFGDNNLVGSLANYLGFLTMNTALYSSQLYRPTYPRVSYHNILKQLQRPKLALVKFASLCRLCTIVTRFSSCPCVYHTKGLETRVACTEKTSWLFSPQSGYHSCRQTEETMVVMRGLLWY